MASIPSDHRTNSGLQFSRPPSLMDEQPQLPFAEIFVPPSRPRDAAQSPDRRLSRTPDEERTSSTKPASAPQQNDGNSDPSESETAVSGSPSSEPSGTESSGSDAAESSEGAESAEENEQEQDQEEETSHGEDSPENEKPSGEEGAESEATTAHSAPLVAQEELPQTETDDELDSEKTKSKTVMEGAAKEPADDLTAEAESSADGRLAKHRLQKSQSADTTEEADIEQESSPEASGKSKQRKVTGKVSNKSTEETAAEIEVPDSDVEGDPARSGTKEPSVLHQGEDETPRRKTRRNGKPEATREETRTAARAQTTQRDARSLMAASRLGENPGAEAANREPAPANSNDAAGVTTEGANAAQPSGPQTLPTPRFSQQLLGRQAPPEAPPLPPAETNRFLHRVAKAFETARQRGGPLRLRLSPPELGSLRLEVRVQGGAIHARLEAETPAARTLLMENLTVLRERLSEQGIRVEQFDVDLMDQQPDHPQDDPRTSADSSFRRHASADEDESQDSTATRDEASEEQDASEIRFSSPDLRDDSLDVRI